MFSKSLISVLLLVASHISLAQSSVWKVEGAGTTLYLGGTFHLLRPGDFPLPAEFDQAYQAADLLVFETDIAMLQDPAAQLALVTQGVYTDGTTLADHLTTETFDRLEDYCRTNQVPIALVSRMKPPIATMTLMMLKMAEFGVSTEGVDTHLFRRASQDHKPTGELETVQQQIEMLLAMGGDQEDDFIRHWLADLAQLQESYEAMNQAWRSGDGDRLGDLLITDLRAEWPGLYQALLVERNQAWLPQILAYQQTPEVEFVLVGAAHLVGPDGVIEALRQAGFEVTQLP